MAQGVLSPAQAAGVGRLASRKEWPLEVLRQVLTTLMREVPRNLLERQVWSGSSSASDWWRRQQHHSRSAAVMCMVSCTSRVCPYLRHDPAWAPALPTSGLDRHGNRGCEDFAWGLGTGDLCTLRERFHTFVAKSVTHGTCGVRKYLQGSTSKVAAVRSTDHHCHHCS